MSYDTPKNKFERDCAKVAETTGISVNFFGAPKGQKQSFYEDDGSLHLHKRGGWACFDVGNGQSLSGKEQNERTRKIMEALGLPITDRVLVDETEDEEDDECPCCGRFRH